MVAKLSKLNLFSHHRNLSEYHFELRALTLKNDFFTLSEINKRDDLDLRFDKTEAQ